MTQTLPDPNTIDFHYSGELVIRCTGCYRELKEGEDCEECGPSTAKEWWRHGTEEENRRDREAEERRKAEYHERERKMEEARAAALRAEKLQNARRRVEWAECRVTDATDALRTAEKALETAKKALQRLEFE